MNTKQIIDNAYKYPATIGLKVGYIDLKELHNKWIVKMLTATKDITILAHRGSFKTTCLQIFIALILVFEPNKTIMLFRKTDTDVAEVLRGVVNILNTAVMRQIIHTLYGKELIFIRLTQNEIHTNLCTSTKGTSQLVGCGITTSITGKHADIVITDDIVNVKDRVSKAERDKTKTAYMELQNIKNRGGRFINLGTPWHKGDAISLMPNVERYDCYSTGLITDEELREIRSKMTDSLFCANYELKHIADTDALFKEPHWTDSRELLFGGVSHIDASYGGSDGTAYTIINRLDDGSIIALGKRWDKHIDDCLDEIQTYQQIFQVGSIYNELNADKGYLAKVMNDRGLFVDTYHEGMNKYVKIATYLKKYWNGIYWLDETDPEYMQEILDYTEHAEHDDSPDSVASLLRETEQAVEYNEVDWSLF